MEMKVRCKIINCGAVLTEKESFKHLTEKHPISTFFKKVPKDWDEYKEDAIECLCGYVLKEDENPKTLTSRHRYSSRVTLHRHTTRT